MLRHPLVAFGRILGLLSILAAVPAMAATPATLFTLKAGTPKILAQGAQKSWPIKISEDQALDAVFQGGMWLPNPLGGRIYAKYQRHILHDNGTWTWIGTVPTAHGEQSVVLTFGKGSVFGTIPQISGYPLRIVTKAGETEVVETSTTMAQSAQQLRLHSKPDYVVPPRPRSQGGANKNSPQVAASVPVQAAASGAVTIDIMVAYTPGFVNELGSQNAALTRIQNLIDITNQAYTASGVNQQIRLVNTVQVNYPDNTSNQSALDDITGIDENGNPVTVPASLQGIAALRVQYGADLVSLIRSYDNATQGDCGVGWLIGGNQTPIVPSQASAFGYSVVSDGSSGGYYCLPTTFAHELGHNMGDAHDRANASESGAYPYSYGYLGNGKNGFSTIMAYGTDATTPLSLFSNPNISSCQNTPCGVADSASNSADNVHSMNNTAALIAQFEPAKVNTPTQYARNDVNGDGISDLLWYNPASHQLIYWVMNGSAKSPSSPLSVPVGYTPIATGDFNGDGLSDVLWTDAGGNVFMWINNGGGAFTNVAVAQSMSGWKVVGTVDINKDGQTDLIWYNSSTGAMTYWLMNGATMLQWNQFQTSPGLQMLAAGTFDGTGYGDIIWKTPSGVMYMWMFSGNGSFTYSQVGQYPAGWVFAGTGDVNADGKTDLFWYNPSTGQMTYWLMNGPALTAWQAFWTNPGLTPLATGRFDGVDAGLTWKLPSGAIYMWQFNAANPASMSYYSLGAAQSGFNAIP